MSVRSLRTWSARVIAVASIASFCGLASAQCACSGGTVVSESGAVYTGAVMGPEALLQEAEDPSTTINLRVVVHEKAIVSINGEPTYTMGYDRPYIVRGLKPGKSYEFTVSALLKNEHGAEFGASEKVKVAAGGNKEIVLHLRRQKRSAPPAAPAPVPAPAAAAPK